MAGAGVLVFAGVFANISNFAYSAYLGRELSLEEFGLIGLTSSFLAFTRIAHGALGKSTSHKSAFLLGKHDAFVKSFWRNTRRRVLLISIIATLAWLVGTPYLKSFFNSDTFIPFILFAPVWIFTLVGAVDLGFLSGVHKFKTLALLVIVESISKLGLAIIFVQLGLIQWVYAAIPLSLFVAFVSAWLLATNLKEKAQSVVSKKDLEFPKAFFSASLVGDLALISFLSLDVVLVKHYLSPDLAGQYVLLSLSGKIIYFASSLVSQFINPIVSRHEGSKQNSEKFFLLTFGLILAISSAAYIVVGLFGNLTLPILFGEKANDITNLAPVYGIALLGFSLGHALVQYNLARKNYYFSIIAFIVIIAEIVGINKFHDSLGSIVYVMAAIGTSYAITAALFYSLEHSLSVLASNIVDFFGLFQKTTTSKNGRLRILVYNWRDTKHVWAGGAEVYVSEIAKRWAKQGHSVYLFVGNDGKSKRNEKNKDGVNIIRRGGFYTVYLWAFLYYIFNFRGKFDVVVESENGLPFFTPLYSRAKKFLIVHHVQQEVFRNHLSFPFAQLAMFIEKRIVPIIYGNQKIITVSESSKSNLVKLGRDSKNISIVKPGINLSQYKKYKKTINPSFVYLGRLKHYKNINVAIKAFAQIVQAYPTATLSIAGEGDESSNLKALTNELRLSASVKFLGKVGHKQKQKVLAKSWAMVQPSSFEGWGITVIESNASGTPVIASNVSGLKDSVVDDKTGILVKAEDVNGFARAMERIVRGSAYRNKLSSGGYEWSKNFSWNRNANLFMQIIESELGSQRGKSELPRPGLLFRKS